MHLRTSIDPSSWSKGDFAPYHEGFIMVAKKPVALVGDSTALFTGLRTILVEHFRVYSVTLEQYTRWSGRRFDATVLVDIEVDSIRSCSVHAGVAILTDTTEVQLRNLIRLGVTSVLPSRASVDKIVLAVELAAYGIATMESHLVQDLESRIEAPMIHVNRLPDLDLRLLAGIARGLSVSRIARQLGLSEREAFRHLDALWATLGADCRAEGLVRAVEYGIVRSTGRAEGPDGGA